MRFLRLTFTFVLLALWGCAKASDRREITAVESKSPFDPPPRLNATAAERFGVMETQSAHASDLPFHWETPEGWRLIASTPMRMINFAIGEGNQSECYLSLLPGDAGGAAANLNRWRKQMNLSEMTKEEIGKLPTIPLFGAQAIYMAIDGTYAAMQADESKPDYRLLGAILEHGGHTIFVKMVGPGHMVRGEEEHFQSFCESLHLVTHGEHAHGPMEGNERGAADQRHPDPLAPAATMPGESDIAWTAPSGWFAADNRSSMRLVTLRSETDPDVECYITVLPGAAGGVLANLNRWHREMKKPPLTVESLANLRRIPAFGGEAILIEIVGDYQGMGGVEIPDALMIGAIHELPDKTVFVKMVGPQTQARKNAEKFIEFVASLRSPPAI